MTTETVVDRPKAATAAKTRPLTMAQAIAEAIGSEMERDPKVFVMGETSANTAVSSARLRVARPASGKERIMETPISEVGHSWQRAGPRPLKACARSPS